MILNGKKVRDFLAKKIQSELKKLDASPTLAIVQVGKNEASSVYIRQKKLFGEKLGFFVEHIQLSKTVSETALISKIQKLNNDKKINGIIVQLPLPKKINTVKVIDTIAIEKDVDGLNSKNLRFLLENIPGGFIPATTKGILSLLDFYKIPLLGKKVTVVGRSLLVGKPTVLALLNRNATVTVCHRKTKDLKGEVKKADIVVIAAGNPQFIKKSFVRSGQVVIDVGITKVRGILFGDVDFQQVSKVVKAITPVPGGVGPMTVVSLFENVLLSYKRQKGLK